MTTTIDVRLAEGQHAVAGLRGELANANAALTQAQRVLHNGDRVLADVDYGLELAEKGVRASRKAMPVVAVVVGIGVVATVVFVVVKKRRSKTLEDFPVANDPDAMDDAMDPADQIVT